MTFDKLLKKWISDNNLKASVGYERFGKSKYWAWINGSSVPSDNSIPEISDKTGLPFNVITDSINESRKCIEERKKASKQKQSPNTRTLGKMLGEWLSINNFTRKYAREVFGFGFDKWILDQCIPAENRIAEISDKTGYTESEIIDGMRNTNDYMRKTSGRKVHEFKITTEKQLVEGHDNKEVIAEADAVRKLKEGIEGINMNHSDDCAKDTTAKPDSLMAERITVGNPLLNPNIIMEVPKPQENESFDNLLVKFAETYKQIGDIEKQIGKLQALQSDLEMKLVTIKKQIRSAA